MKRFRDIGLTSSRMATNLAPVVLNHIFLTVQGIPIEAQTLILAGVATFSVALDLIADDITDLWDRLKGANPNLSKDLASSAEFQQSFIITLEALARTRNRNKRKLIKAIYLGEYIPSKTREKVALERFYRITQDISIDSIEHLKFIAEVIIPIKEKEAHEFVSSMNGNHDNDDEWWYQRQLESIPESTIIDKWINDEYGTNGRKYKPETPKDKDEWKIWAKPISDKEHEIRNRILEIHTELESFGILRQRGDYNSGKQLTEFGRKFMRYTVAIGNSKKII